MSQNKTVKSIKHKLNKFPSNYLPVFEVQKFLLIFYSVGVLGFLIPFTRDFFVSITPYALLLNVYLLAVYHKSYQLKSIIVFMLVFLLGYFVEVVGVKTGIVFGQYRYGKALGLKFFETPLMIGVNWLFLTYASVSIVNRWRLSMTLRLLLAPLLMLIYDLVLEQVAPKLDMWSWQNDVVPLQNYIAWYAIALFFAGLFYIFRISTKNPLAAIVFICQFIFFILLTIML